MQRVNLFASLYKISEKYLNLIEIKQSNFIQQYNFKRIINFLRFPSTKVYFILPYALILQFQSRTARIISAVAPFYHLTFSSQSSTDGKKRLAEKLLENIWTQNLRLIENTAPWYVLKKKKIRRWKR